MLLVWLKFCAHLLTLGGVVAGRGAGFCRVDDLLWGLHYYITWLFVRSYDLNSTKCDHVVSG